MPLLTICTNHKVEDPTILMADASRLVAKLLGKSEAYVMVVVEDQKPMLFGGSSDPTALLTLKSLGLRPDQTQALSAALCQWVESQLAIPANRIYLAFSDPPRPMWGWNGTTF